VGFFDNWVKPQGKTDKTGMMKGKQARKYAQETVMCKKHGCNRSPGGHSFRFPGASDYCTPHAREVQNDRNKAQAETDAAKARQEARKATQRAAAAKAKEARRNKGK
jgi:hypothetical protein